MSRSQRRIAAFILVTALLAVGSACHAARPAPSGAAVSPGAVHLPAGSSSHTLSVGGAQRTYRVYRPASLPAGPAPLVVMLHGALGTGEQAESSYGWDGEADRGHFIVAYPDGYKRTWNVSSGCCGPASADRIDDVGFVTAMVSAIAAASPIAMDRVYATGISNGGMLDYRLACDTKIFAAIGPDSATMLGSCPSPQPLSIIHIHGTADQTIPYGGGPGRRDNGGSGPKPVEINGPPITALNAAWRGIDQCASPSSQVTGVVAVSVAQCPGSRAVELVTISGAGHQWPGESGPDSLATRLLHLDPPSTALNATDTIWQFFNTHPKLAGS